MTTDRTRAGGRRHAGTGSDQDETADYESAVYDDAAYDTDPALDMPDGYHAEHASSDGLTQPAFPPIPGRASFTDLSLDKLIAMRDRYLAECFDIESGRRFVLDAQDADERLLFLRGRVEEIHEELARRDMEQKEPRAGGADRTAPSSTTADLPCAYADQSMLDDYLTRSQERIVRLDDLARTAQDQGDIEQALACTREAQKIDRERMDCLNRITTTDP